MKTKIQETASSWPCWPINSISFDQWDIQWHVILLTLSLEALLTHYLVRCRAQNKDSRLNSCYDPSTRWRIHCQYCILDAIKSTEYVSRQGPESRSCRPKNAVDHFILFVDDWLRWLIQPVIRSSFLVTLHPSSANCCIRTFTLTVAQLQCVLRALISAKILFANSVWLAAKNSWRPRRLTCLPSLWG